MLLGTHDWWFADLGNRMGGCNIALECQHICLANGSTLRVTVEYLVGYVSPLTHIHVASCTVDCILKIQQQHSYIAPTAPALPPDSPPSVNP